MGLEPSFSNTNAGTLPILPTMVISFSLLFSLRFSSDADIVRLTNARIIIIIIIIIIYRI